MEHSHLPLRGRIGPNNAAAGQEASSTSAGGTGHSPTAGTDQDNMSIPSAATAHPVSHVIPSAKSLPTALSAAESVTADDDTLEAPDVLRVKSDQPVKQQQQQPLPPPPQQQQQPQQLPADGSSSLTVEGSAAAALQRPTSPQQPHQGSSQVAAAGRDIITSSASGEPAVPTEAKTAAAAAEGDDSDARVFLNEEELLAQSTFPIPPDELIAMARSVIKAGVHKCGRLSDDFQFTAPFIGPLNREEFSSTMETLKLEEVFPNMEARVYHLRVDPLMTNRVWFTNRPVGCHLGYLTAKLPIPVAPTGKVVELPPQTSSLSFNGSGEVIDFTMGYVMDRGLGGAFGLLYGIGVPFPYPEGKPWESSWQQRLFNSGNPVLQAAMFLLDRVTSAILPNWLITKHNRNLQ